MVENKTILFICVSVCICQAVIWRIYTSTVSVDISKMDGIISDPRHGLATGANCSTASKGEWKHTALETQSSRYVKPTYMSLHVATESRLQKSHKNKDRFIYLLLFLFFYVWWGRICRLFQHYYVRHFCQKCHQTVKQFGSRSGQIQNRYI